MQPLPETIEKYLLPAAIAVWAWLTPVHPVLVAITALPFADLLLALAVAFRTKKPTTLWQALRVIESRGLQQTTWKVVRYSLATVLAFVTEQYLTGPGMPAVRVIAGFLGATELKSCLEHLDALGGPPVFKTVLAKIAPPLPPTEGDPK